MGIGLLALINQWLGFFSVRNQARGRIYSIVGFIANFYLLYVGVRLIINRQIWGIVFLLAFVVLLYFSVLNMIYYFTDKTVKWDISPLIDHFLGGDKAEEEAALKTVPANGLYRRDQVLGTVIVSSLEEQENLSNLYQRMLQAKLIEQNYGHFSRSQIKRYLLAHETISANYPGTLLPYFDLKYVPSGLLIYGGMNQFSARPIGVIVKVGLSDAMTALQGYQLSLASVVIHGGQGRQLDPTHSKIVAVSLANYITAEVAYKKREI
ncbi:DUF6681 family protein [Oenococcus kitaharae]|uniref:Uncharacterized protein n=1 Tax=Oenococcus kitaharae DSM 17330 TaxID=1045004 RepID=G9WIZ9_9LACO|nr:DUF6681 family protein [Oenococcus kitaharae]EHN58448.1 hypothetical protein OKIT_0326 [Oenococcus kitaharae DSM 17330]MCV3296313.1 hypothetical protein [Oenococcus kitaharae]OEY81396.1 hypothetical protein NT95_07720 [Oenococcus kitaharae]OEY82884.1 hypothetical protein NV75_05820 [Oenococcus kitaharae]OEY84572.1 hypothetical protein NT96_04815 [Oenococcus kitaharae]